MYIENEYGGIMKKITALFMLILTLSLSGIFVHATEKDYMQVVNKYVNLFLDEVKDTKSEESISVLEDSLEQFIKNVNPEDAKKIIDFMNEKIDEGKWESEEGIKESITEAEKKFKVTLTKEQKEMIFSLIKRIKIVEISPKYLLEQIADIYEKYGEELKQDFEKGKEKIVKETKNKIKEEINKIAVNYFSDMVNNVKLFFKGIFRK